MDVPTSEFGYTSATTGRGDHEMYMDMWGKKEKRKRKAYSLKTHFLYHAGSTEQWGNSSLCN
jgi:hypothetical protein